MIRKRSVSITTDASGDGESELTLGHPYARVVRVRAAEATTATTDIAIVDADDQAIFGATGVDDSPAYSKYVVVAEGDVADTAGEAAAADSAVSPTPIAHSPLTITLANGGNTKTHTVEVYVEGSYH